MSGSVEAINDMRATQKLTSRDGRSSLRKRSRRLVKKFMIILLAVAALYAPATAGAHIPAADPSAKTLAQKGVDLEYRYKHVSGHVKWIKAHYQRYVERYLEQRYVEELYYYQKSKRRIKKSLLWVWSRTSLVEKYWQQAQPVMSGWMCVHGHEGAWPSDTGNGFHGGLQMDLGFQGSYGPVVLGYKTAKEMFKKKGTADNWTPKEQIAVAEYARTTGKRGWYPWPNTARACGLI